MDGVHGSDVAKKAEGSDKNAEKLDNKWPKDAPS
jgi:hypothetical protein